MNSGEFVNIWTRQRGEITNEIDVIYRLVKFFLFSCSQLEKHFALELFSCDNELSVLINI